MRPTEQRGQHLAGLVGVVVDGLLAEDDKLGLFLADHGRQQLGHAERLQFDVGVDQHGAVGADGHRGAQGLLAGCDAAAHRDHLGRSAFLPQANGFFHGDFVKGVHAHLHPGDIDAAGVGLDTHLDVVIHHALDGDQDFHPILLCVDRLGSV
ncbi:hypothetical protein GALL_529520 [mine drainage metagenome]|uniref:Uncharacterized protein n=1 Tax=mine drainage metagenome TaxID=410659 RepID=A0A1J5P1S0_9ZZZZ